MRWCPAATAASGARSKRSRQTAGASRVCSRSPSTINGSLGPSASSFVTSARNSTAERISSNEHAPEEIQGKTAPADDARLARESCPRQKSLAATTASHFRLPAESRYTLRMQRSQRRIGCIARTLCHGLDDIFAFTRRRLHRGGFNRFELCTVCCVGHELYSHSLHWSGRRGEPS